MKHMFIALLAFSVLPTYAWADACDPARSALPGMYTSLFQGQLVDVQVEHLGDKEESPDSFFMTMNAGDQTETETAVVKSVGDVCIATVDDGKDPAEILLLADNGGVVFVDLSRGTALVLKRK